MYLLTMIVSLKVRKTHLRSKIDEGHQENVPNSEHVDLQWIVWLKFLQVWYIRISAIPTQRVSDQEEVGGIGRDR